MLILVLAFYILLRLPVIECTINLVLAAFILHHIRLLEIDRMISHTRWNAVAIMLT